MGKLVKLYIEEKINDRIINDDEGQLRYLKSIPTIKVDTIGDYDFIPSRLQNKTLFGKQYAGYHSGSFERYYYNVAVPKDKFKSYTKTTTYKIKNINNYTFDELRRWLPALDFIEFCKDNCKGLLDNE